MLPLIGSTAPFVALIAVWTRRFSCGLVCSAGVRCWCTLDLDGCVRRYGAFELRARADRFLSRPGNLALPAIAFSLRSWEPVFRRLDLVAAGQLEWLVLGCRILTGMFNVLSELTPPACPVAAITLMCDSPSGCSPQNCLPGATVDGPALAGLGLMTRMRLLMWQRWQCPRIDRARRESTRSGSSCLPP